MKVLCLVVLFVAASWAGEVEKEWASRVKNYVNFVKSHPALYKEAMKKAEKYNHKFTPEENTVTRCEVLRSPSNPTSVNRVMPSDVRLVGALGDSISAGFGIDAETIIDVAIQNRHKSWSAGVDQDYRRGVITYPNMLKHFNPNIQGGSTGESFPDDPEAGLNVAVGGAIAVGMPAQADHFVEKLQAGHDDGTWNMDEDWKVITLLIGGNDLCRACDGGDSHTPQNFVGAIRETLDILRRDVPRALVYLTPMFDVTPLHHMSDGIICDGFQLAVCPCGIDEDDRDFTQRQVAEYNRLMGELVGSGRYDSEEFTVIYQLHLRDAIPPLLPDGSDVDRSYWSPDCFHPGTKGHYGIATSLWNNTLQREGSKTTTVNWNIGGPMLCPTRQNPYIFTRGNSGTGTQTQLDVLAERERKMMMAADQPELGKTGPEVSGAVNIVGLVVGVALAALVTTLAVVGVVRFVKKRKESKATSTVDNPAYDANA